jgi:hypothetical protein
VSCRGEFCGGRDDKKLKNEQRKQAPVAVEAEPFQEGFLDLGHAPTAANNLQETTTIK